VGRVITAAWPPIYGDYCKRLQIHEGNATRVGVTVGAGSALFFLRSSSMRLIEPIERGPERCRLSSGSAGDLAAGQVAVRAARRVRPAVGDELAQTARSDRRRLPPDSAWLR